MKKPSPNLLLPRLIGGGSATVIAIFTRLTVGSPMTTLHQIPADLLPPIWLLSVLWLGSFALLGASAGALLACPKENHQREAYLWRGGTFMVLSMMFSLDWYTLLFGKFLLLPSCLCLIMSAAAALICFFSWIHVHPNAAISAGIFFLWQTCLLLIQLVVLLRI